MTGPAASPDLLVSERPTSLVRAD